MDFTNGQPFGALPNSDHATFERRSVSNNDCRASSQYFHRRVSRVVLLCLRDDRVGWRYLAQKSAAIVSRPAGGADHVAKLKLS